MPLKENQLLSLHCYSFATVQTNADFNYRYTHYLFQLVLQNTYVGAHVAGDVRAGKRMCLLHERHTCCRSDSVWRTCWAEVADSRSVAALARLIASASAA